jgi:hypothetical protein
LLDNILRRTARRILILLLKSIIILPSAKRILLRVLARRPWLESHAKGFSYVHRLSLFDPVETNTPGAAANIVWANFDPAVRRLYGRLEQTRMRHETRH